MRWTQDRLVELQAMREADNSLKEIADTIGVTKDCIRAAIRIHGLPRAEPPTHWSAESDATLKALLEGGSSFYAAADAMGKSRNAVMGRAKRMGLKSPIAPCVAGSGAKKAPPKRKVPKPVVVPDNPPIPLERASTRSCRWPTWDDQSNGRPDYPVCGARTETGSSWCAFHQRKVFTSGAKANAEDRARSKEAARVTGSVRAFG